MKTFTIPVSWEMCGFIEIYADTIEEAVEIFDKDSDTYELPSESNYVDGSFERADYDLVEYYNDENSIFKNKNKVN